MSTFSYPVRSEVQSFDPYTPGLCIEEIQERFNLSVVVKMASNENPLGVSPQVQRVIANHADRVFRYAQSDMPNLMKALSEFHGIAPGHFVAGNGSDELIDLLIRVCPSPGVHNVVTSKPAFSMYGLQCRLCGVEHREVPLKEDFSFDWQRLRAAVDAHTAMLFLTTPDNPSGYCPPASDVADFVRSLPSTCLVVVDEAYTHFVDDEAMQSLLARREEFPNVVFLRTFSKCFGLAGLRLGYGVMPVELANILKSVRSPFSVNLLAEEAGIAALADVTFHKATLDVVRSGRAFLFSGMQQMGCRVYPSQANFLMFSLPKSCSLSARRVFELLLEKGVIIRPLSSYTLPDHLRVSVGTMAENTLFLTMLQGVLA